MSRVKRIPLFLWYCTIRLLRSKYKLILVQKFVHLISTFGYNKALDVNTDKRLIK